jgi:hypothetical protein
MIHTLDDCKKNIHIKHWDERKGSQFMCLCCLYILPALVCPECSANYEFLEEHKDSTITCHKKKGFGECGYNFIGRLDKIDDPPEQNKELEDLMNGEDEVHEKGFSKGVIYRWWA